MFKIHKDNLVNFIVLLILQISFYTGCIYLAIDSRPIFIIDYFIAAAVGYFNARLGIIFLIFVFLVVFVDTLASAYHFDLIPFVLSANQLMPEILMANWLLIVAFIFLLLIHFLIFRKYGSLSPKFSFVFVALIIVVDVSMGTSNALRLGNSMMNFKGLDFSSSIMNRMYIQLKNLYIKNPDEKFSKTESALSKLSNLNGRSIILVVVESLGARRGFSADENYGLNEAFADAKNLRVITTGLVKSHGSTVSGELRELCGISIRNMSTNIDFTNCPTWNYRFKNYTMTAAHSYRASMFGRKEWWPRLGFEKMIFKDDVISKYPLCPGALNSICDSFLLEGELSKMSGREPYFFYYLTSNTHLPLPAGVDVHSFFLNNLKILIDTIEHTLDSNNSISVDVVIVGDHPPPLLGEIRKNYVDKEVPYWIMRYK